MLDGRVGRGMENGEEGSEVQAGEVLQLHHTNQEGGRLASLLIGFFKMHHAQSSALLRKRPGLVIPRPPLDLFSSNSTGLFFFHLQVLLQLLCLFSFVQFQQLLH